MLKRRGGGGGGTKGLDVKGLVKDKLYNTEDLQREANILRLKERRHVHVLLCTHVSISPYVQFKLWKKYQSTGVRTRSGKKNSYLNANPKMRNIKEILPTQVQNCGTAFQLTYKIYSLGKAVHKLSQTQEALPNAGNIKSKSKSKAKSRLTHK